MSTGAIDSMNGRAPARTAGVALLLAALVAAGSAAAARSGTVSGAVTDIGGEPLAGVEVSLVSGDGVAASTMTDKRGRFSLSAAEGEYRIVFAKEGYATFEGPLSIEAGGRQRVGVELLDAAAGRRSEAAAAFNDGVAAYEAGDKAAAKERFRAAVAADPTLVRAYRVLADILLEEGAWADAAKAAESYLAVEPGDRQAQLLAYEAYRKLQDGDRLTSMRRELGADPVLAGKLALQAFNEGARADQAGDAETAAARFAEALELDPALAAAHFGLGALHYRGDRHEEAQTAVEAGLALEPASAQGRRLAYAVAAARGDAAAAAAAMRAYTEVDPDGAAALLFERAKGWFDGGDAAAARQGLARLLEIRTDHAGAHHLLGLASLTSDPAAARRHLERFLELAPEDPEAATVREILASLD